MALESLAMFAFPTSRCPNGPKALTEAMQRFLMEVLFINNGITSWPNLTM